MEKKQNKFGNSLKNLFVRLFGFGKAKKDSLQEEEIMSPTKQIFKKFIRNRIAITGLVIFISIILFVTIGNEVIKFRASYNELSQAYVQPKLGYTNVPRRLQRSGVKVVVDNYGVERHLIEGGATFTVAISNDNQIYVWGATIYNNDILNVPQEIQDRAEDIVQISVGTRHAIALTRDGEFLGWGRNHFQQAQMPVYDDILDKDFQQFKKSIDAYFNPEVRDLYAEEVITTIEEDPIKEIYAGFEMTSVLTESGVVYTWGVTRTSNLSEPRNSFRFMELAVRFIGNELEWQQRGIHRQWFSFRTVEEVNAEFGISDIEARIVEFRVFNDNLQWKYDDEAEENWDDITSVAQIISDFNIEEQAGKEILIRYHGYYLQYRYDDETDDDWIDVESRHLLLIRYGLEDEPRRVVHYRILDGNFVWKYTNEPFSAWRVIITNDDIVNELSPILETKTIVKIHYLIDNLVYEFDDNTFVMIGLDGEIRNVPDFFTMTPEQRGEVQFRFEYNPEIRYFGGNLQWNREGTWSTFTLGDDLDRHFNMIEIKENANDRLIKFQISDVGDIEWKYEGTTNWTVLIPQGHHVLRNISFGLQWKYSNEFVWNQVDVYGSLINDHNLQEQDGKEIEIQYSDKSLQWKYDDESEWKILSTREELNTKYGLVDIESFEITKVVGNRTNAFVLKDDGNIFSWGQYSSANRLNDIPADVQTSNIVDIEMGMYHIVALDDQGNVYTWGSNNELNQLNMPKNLHVSQKISSNFFNTISIGEDGEITMWGNNGYAFGTNHIGQDIFKRIIAGGTMTLSIAAIAVVISTVIGLIVGLIAGFYGKWVDNLLMRFGEVVNSFPFLPLVITLSAILRDVKDETGALLFDEKARIFMVMVILGVLSWPWLSRLVRGQILAEREKDFVMAAKALGVRERNIILKHILPNVVNVVIVNVALSYAGFLLAESALSYLGFGVQEPQPSWGNMLTSAQSPTILRNYWWMWIFPGLFVILAALSINLVGDGLREAMDPKGMER